MRPGGRGAEPCFLTIIEEAEEVGVRTAVSQGIGPGPGLPFCMRPKHFTIREAFECKQQNGGKVQKEGTRWRLLISSTRRKMG